MKPGEKYERFVHAKLVRLFRDAKVKLNDKIAGRESKFDREIDVSVRMTVGDTELLYIVQCKDWNSRVDINTLGEFSAVMQDVGAAKGFLVCTSGFCETNYQYALARGIELVTIEDIQSDKWTTEIQIPFVYVRKVNNYTFDIEIVANEALVELNRGRELTLTVALPVTLVRASGGQLSMTLEEHVLQRVKDPAVRAREGVIIDLTDPNLEIDVAGIWTPCSHLSVVLRITKTRYLKYITPSQYSQLRDHVRGTTLPLHVKIEDINVRLDHTFAEMSPDSLSKFPGLWLEVEESNIVPVS